MTKKELLQGWFEKEFAPAYERCRKENMTFDLEYAVECAITADEDDPILLRLLKNEPINDYINNRDWHITVENRAINLIDVLTCSVQEAVVFFQYLRYYAMMKNSRYITPRFISAVLKKVGLPDEQSFKKLWKMQKIDFNGNRQYYKVHQLENENAFYNFFWID